jgi:hypothetical protein
MRLRVYGLGFRFRPLKDTRDSHEVKRAIARARAGAKGEAG